MGQVQQQGFCSRLLQKMPQELLAKIDSSDAITRTAALNECQTLAELPPEALLAAIRHTEDTAPEAREAAVAVCERDDEWDTYLVEPLAKLLGQVRHDAAYWCATLLGRFGADAAPAVPALSAALGQLTYAPALQRIVLALGKIGPAAASAKPLIAKFTEHSDPHLARTAREVLAQLT
jgi:ubiquinone biosynthesis protein UbiJ